MPVTLVSMAKTIRSRLAPVGLLLAATASQSEAGHLFDAANHPTVPGWNAGLTASDAATGNHYASAIMADAQLVARGEFASHCDTSHHAMADDKRVDFDTWPPEGVDRDHELFRREYVISSFRIEELFKGPGTTSVVSIKIDAEILAYPGFPITVYEMRHRLAKPLRARTDLVADKLSKAYSERNADAPITAHHLALGQELLSLIEDFNALQFKTITVDNGRLLWELGGVIRCGHSYLVALSPDERGEYVVDSYFDGTIWWGQDADRVAEAIRHRAWPFEPSRRTRGDAHGACYVCRRPDPQ